MADVKFLGYFLNSVQPDVLRQHSIQLINNFIVVDPVLIWQLEQGICWFVQVLLTNLHFGWDSIAEGMDSFIRPGSSRPFDSFEVSHVGLQDESLLEEYLLHCVFDSPHLDFLVSLELHPSEVLAVVTEE